VANADGADAVLDASAVVELLLGTDTGLAVGALIHARGVHAPAHLDAEVLAALGRLHRAGAVDAEAVSRALAVLAEAPIKRHPLADLLAGAWTARDHLRLADALYVELARALGSLVLLTTDGRLAGACDLAQLPGAPR
jgi:predicted nucleic acid-binding protein